MSHTKEKMIIVFFNSFSLKAPALLLNLKLFPMCYLFQCKAKAKGKGDNSSTNGHHTPLVNGNTLVTEHSMYI